MQTRKILSVVLAASVAAAFGLTGCSKSEQNSVGDKTTQTQAPQARNTSAVIADLQTRLKENPNDGDTLWHLGDAYFEARQFNEATTYYKKALLVKPNEVDIYNELGLSIHYLGNTDDGLKVIEEGIKKDPLHQRIWLTKGYLLAYGKGDLESAKTAWEKAKALNPESQVGKAASEYLAQLTKK